MRITTGMTQNTMMMNINRNASYTNKLYGQIATGKKIQVPSEDPILASRALRFRTNISETEQYIRNTNQAMAWTEITAQAFMNQSALSNSVGELLTQGANDTLELSDRQKIMADVSSLVEQLGQEMNATYAGRYVFSGYRTDEPPVLFDGNNDEYSIKQTFNFEDVEETKSYQKHDSSEPARMHDIDVIKLPYTNVGDDTDGDGIVDSGITINGTTANLVYSSNQTDTPDPYKPGPDEIVYIQETGELVLGENALEDLQNGDLEIEYNKRGFDQGELNPKVYFECTDIKVGSPTEGITFDMIGQDNMEYEIGVGSKMTVNSLAKDVYPAKYYAELKNLVNSINSMTVSSERDVRAKFEAEGLAGEELDEAVKNQIQQEEAQVRAISQDRISDMIAIVEEYSSESSIRETDLGTRMSRLELSEMRLNDNLITYETLKSQNEDVDMAQAIFQLNSAEAVYQASLNVGSKVIQMSLVDFIR